MSERHKVYHKNTRKIIGSKRDRLIEYGLVAFALIVVLLGAIL